MAKYFVQYTELYNHCMEVEAKSETEAREVFRETLDSNADDVLIDDIGLVEEDKN